MYQMTLSLFLDSTLETIYMAGFSSITAMVVGLPLGVILYITRKKGIFENQAIYKILSFIVNIMRSIPFLILMVSVIPLTRFITGTSIGPHAAIVPLSLSAMPFIARIVENAMLEVNKGLIEAATAMGANNWQITFKVLIPESLSNIINGLTLTVINLIGYSSMAGAVGGGGLGDLAIRYGYQRFDTKIMLITIIIIVALVQIVQIIGDKFAKHFNQGK
ncbi:ABC transporter permease [Gammaproteobacteria bacterium]|nr:ABC transporter permease [Gammaproteobacteria bacterium]